VNRSRLSLLSLSCVLVALLLLGACGGDPDEKDTADQDTDVVDTDVVPDTEVDTTPEGTQCCPLGNCPIGESCVSGACLPTALEATCYLDANCGLGQVCDAETLCGCGDVGCDATPGSCRYPEGCCQGDGECSGTEACVDGTCQAAVAGGCWRDDDCTGGQTCEGLERCACDDASCTAKAGVCGQAGVCCLTDEECGADGLCRAGRCLVGAGDGRCYADGDCTVSGETCLGDVPCSCGDIACAQPNTRGTCGAEGSACCDDATDCGNGEICVDGIGCHRAPAITGTVTDQRYECWADDHCGRGATCVGATTCGCGDATCVPAIGECRTDVATCGADSDCDPGMRCVTPDTDACPGAPPATTGICVEAVDAVTGCWTSDDCLPFERCSAETICTEAGGCTARNRPGLCSDLVKLRDCCDSHRECEDGLECRNQNTSLTCPPDNSAICVPTPAFGQTCWNYLDCPEGDACNRSWMCGCNGKCRWNRLGDCEKPVFCQSDIDCGSEEVCARDPECILSPCTTQATCNPGGQCQPLIEDFCWTHDECGEGNYCENLKVCPPASDCLVPDAPGECAPRAPVGDCCTSYRGCDVGLRCVSVAGATGCTLDNTAVCVPAIVNGTDCFGDDDCGPDQRCSGAVICPCGVDNCDTVPQAGSCIAEL
jgi:hypothetical protein